jgi:hypothetical protein
MTGRLLLRWSGLAGVAGGGLLILLDLAYLVFYGDAPERVAAATATWPILLNLNIAAGYLALLALIGLYGRQIEEAGRFGLVGFFITALGMVLYLGFLWAGAFIIPALTAAAPEFLDQVEAGSPPASVAAGFVSTFVLLALGWLLFALASLRARVLPPAPAWFLILGAILGLASRLANLGVPGVLLGLGLAWLGLWLWADQRRPSPEQRGEQRALFRSPGP